MNMMCTQVQLMWPWLDQVTPESAELFDEVITKNVYDVHVHHVQNRTVIDIGANQGMFTMWCLALGASQVIAAEPVPDTFHVLQGNVHKAHVSHKVISICRAVTHAHGAQVELHLQPKSGHNSMYKGQGVTHMAHTCTLADLTHWAEQPEIYLKMDCEGAEYDIMLHTPDSVFDRIKWIALEIHGHMHPVHKGVHIMHHRLHELGYKLVNRKQMGMWWYNAQGEQVRFDPMEQTTEIWSK